ncbi:conserved hypothetical protein [Theileria equi strain WA]|uniref:Uncharacterized protein n=1 Tax=Theileria equi strain WA TaxID=1537102 RepID=L1L9E9_THEEQ|nr:conserved hypothetical protein [Theileria equi strain WA]EKX72037.1 conserved hypothetical protein [Theileria equi strain WA]|eukprot:XP_004831489.1 conserved hypothetical protein [Theileria equi strain WA]
MAKKNARKAVQHRLNIVKKDFLAASKKKQDRHKAKNLQNELKLQIMNLSLDGSTRMTEKDDDVEMSFEKNKNPGINFARDFDSSRPIRARDKKIVQRALKRKRKMGK